VDLDSTPPLCKFKKKEKKKLYFCSWNTFQDIFRPLNQVYVCVNLQRNKKTERETGGKIPPEEVNLIKSIILFN
jgi:hypothetical protein